MKSGDLLIAVIIALCLATCDSCAGCRANVRQLYCSPAGKVAQ